MRPETAAALHRINLDFYERQAASFAEKRSNPWPGWQRVADETERLRPGAARRPSVLDLGCGHGRLAAFLDQRWQGGFAYLGLDASASLLDLAAARQWRADCRFLRRDLLVEGLPAELRGAPFDLIAIFGVLHHMPGVENRRALLRRAARLLAPSGLLAVSFWQFGDRERFRRRVVPWEDYNRAAREPIDVFDLEPGDTLLAWGAERTAGEHPAAEPSAGERPAAERPAGERPAAERLAGERPAAEISAGERPAAEISGLGWRPLRYCCWTPPEEAERLLAGLPLEAVCAFTADGAGNDLNLDRVHRARAGV